jgi:site-specific recombinase XerD
MLKNNKITSQIEEYIAYKQSLGFQIKIESQELRRFAKYTKEIDYRGSLTADLALNWAALDENYSRWYKSRRLETIHTFAVYITSFDQEAQLPPNYIFGKCHGRIQPYIYSENEIHTLMSESRNLFSPDGIRALTVEIALGLLWSTGIRVSELTTLKIADMNLEKSYFFIRNSKFKKDRIVVLHPTVNKKLCDYSDYVNWKLGKRSETEYFFVTTYGQRFNTRAFEYAFQLIRPCLNTNPALIAAPRMPRLYDLRHTFACQTIKRWLENDENVNQKLHLLSTYMGHVKPKDTFWYLSATPDLLSISCSKYEEAFGKGEWSNEVD